jgi:hypothetical protein
MVLVEIAADQEALLEVRRGAVIEGLRPMVS